MRVHYLCHLIVCMPSTGFLLTPTWSVFFLMFSKYDWNSFYILHYSKRHVCASTTCWISLVGRTKSPWMPAKSRFGHTGRSLWGETDWRLQISAVRNGSFRNGMFYATNIEGAFLNCVLEWASNLSLSKHSTLTM